MRLRRAIGTREGDEQNSVIPGLSPPLPTPPLTKNLKIWQKSNFAFVKIQVFNQKFDFLIKVSVSDRQKLNFCYKVKFFFRNYGILIAAQRIFDCNGGFLLVRKFFRHLCVPVMRDWQEA